MDTNSNNSTFDKSYDTLTLYNEKILLSSNILPYAPKSVDQLWKNYEKQQVLYSVAMSPTIVYKAIEKNSKSAQKYAIKHLKKDRLNQKYLHEFANNEYTIHKSLSLLSDYIVKVIEYYEDSESYFMVMEYSPQHGYFEELLEKQYQPILNEQLLKNYAYDMLKSISLLHQNNIIHCDIKPQNFLLFFKDRSNIMDRSGMSNTSNMSNICKDTNRDSINLNSSANECKLENLTLDNKIVFDQDRNNTSVGSFTSYEDEEETILKLTDFGLAHIISNEKKHCFAKFSCGTNQYKAPELVNNSYIDQSVDMWSLGVCLYQMATAYHPSSIKKYRYGSGDIPFRQIDWKHLDNGGKELQNLIKSCLLMEPNKRITAKEALKHKWFDS